MCATKGVPSGTNGLPPGNDQRLTMHTLWRRLHNNGKVTHTSRLDERAKLVTVMSDPTAITDLSGTGAYQRNE